MSFWRDENKANPRALAEIKFKGKQNLEDAVRAGEVKEVIDDGQKFYSWRTITVGKGGKTESRRDISKSGKIDEATYAKIIGLLQNVGWSFNYTLKDQQVIVCSNVFQF